jgi:hypothetical protein
MRGVACSRSERLGKLRGRDFLETFHGSSTLPRTHFKRAVGDRGFCRDRVQEAFTGRKVYSTMVNLQAQYQPSGCGSGGHPTHSVLILGSMASAKEGYSTIPPDLQG